ncbi:MAG TPA: hypothetical protein PKH69_08650 [Thiobacillaceae bacterium]|nr:hypothetical protein [Thiobacillaceae bacterium]HNU64561.1 hypothetical protein [Thiobacillaceae bacterium]
MALDPTAFHLRYRRWQDLHRQAGAGRSYPHARRLPGLARPLGPAGRHTAENALALDLYSLGRFQEALAVLSPDNTSPPAGNLRQRLALLRHGAIPAGVQPGPAQAAYLAYLADQPRTCVQALARTQGGEADPAWLTVLGVWARARLGQKSDPGPGHQALASLRRPDSALAAQAEALHAEAAFHLGARWAVVWLDLALEQAERFGQHHMKARLLFLKAYALEAAGEPGEGARFRNLARCLAERQGAFLYLELFLTRR